MNKIGVITQEKDGLDCWEDLVAFAASGISPQELDEAHLQRFKWYGVFHRPQKPGTFMMRLRITGGRLTSSQARVIAGIAREHGGGSADITTRQNLQLRDLLLPDIPGIIQRLNQAGITTRQTGMDNVRNFIGCPLAGIDGMELFDSTPLVNALAEAHLAAGKEFSNLPRKFNVSIAGCRDGCGDAQSQDLGFVPATRDRDGRRVAGFNVLVGGALGATSPRLATPLDVFVTPEEVVPFFLALLRVYRDNGPAMSGPKPGSNGSSPNGVKNVSAMRLSANAAARCSGPASMSASGSRATTSASTPSVRSGRTTSASTSPLDASPPMSSKASLSWPIPTARGSSA